MGGPFWAGRDTAAWSIPKGLYKPGESTLQTALREFEEEIGVAPPPVDYQLLGEFRQPSGKLITVYFGESDLSIAAVESNTFALEWPKGSGKIRQFPEIDNARWFEIGIARTKLVRGQLPILEALVRAVG